MFRRSLFAFTAGLFVAFVPAVANAGASERAAAPSTTPTAPSVERARPAADAESYCEWTRAAASSESAPLLAPSLFVSGGVVNGMEGSLGASGTSPTTRITAGASYSVSGLVKGIMIRKRASRECERYRIASRLQAFVQTYREGESAGALAAKLAVLNDGLSRAESIVERSKVLLRDGRATVDQVTDEQIRLDTLRVDIGHTKRDLDVIATRAVPNPGELSGDLRNFAQSEAAIEDDEAAIRRSSAWDLSLRGGYDRFVGVRDDTPLFGVATLTVNVGMLGQFGADARAVKSRAAWADKHIDGPSDRAHVAIHKLRAVSREAHERLTGHAALVDDLTERFRIVEGLNRDSTRAAANVLWFDLLTARADHEYLRALIVEVDAILEKLAA